MAAPDASPAHGTSTRLDLNYVGGELPETTRNGGRIMAAKLLAGTKMRWVARVAGRRDSG